MIQQSHLTAWQAYAPWPKRSQIEQDLRLSRGVAAIFTDAILTEHLAMRGAHGAPQGPSGACCPVLGRH
ncbi:hypothetical protein [Cupriavidus sp. CuC1]|uniref:hypothetical protein n=1 Tax=Cupriavidus sp. CuC1 TaxID=3373131 RepID=UPI0037D5BFB7